MFKIKLKIVYIYLLFINLLFFINYSITSAATLQGDTVNKLGNQLKAFEGESGFNPNITLGGIIALVIQAFLGLLGIIFVVLIVIAGNKWMNARGNEEKVEEAQDTIRRAIIGLIITVSAYAITYFVFSNLPG